MSNNKNLLYLFDRPSEPIFIGKGEDNATFDLPAEYLTDRYKPVATDLQTRFPSTKSIPVVKLSKIPDISLPMSLDRNKPFSLFNPYHSKMAAKLIEILLATKSTDELLSLAAYCRDRINPYMFIYALSVVVTHRPDTRNLPLPSHVEMFPSLYMDSAVFNRAREESTVLEAGSRTPIEIPHDYTANHLDMEHRVGYFREDIGINLHHWHWHLVYPFEGPIEIVQKDRRGELFYYMHQQVVARYNIERLSNDLNRVVRFTNWHDPIEEGYFPKLDNIVANRVWPPRPANAKLSNINRETEQIIFDIEDLERWRDRIFNAIHSGFIIDANGQQVRLTDRTDDNGGINILGNIVEASILSRNPTLYGSLHNNGHNAIAFIHDPDNRYLENYGVMGDSSTAMRDPVFYRWHAYIDDIFQEFKSTLSGYTTQNLTFENVRVDSIQVTAQSLSPNEFATFWQKSDVNLSRGMDFAPRGAVFARFTHLQHAPFSYKIRVNNGGNQRNGTVRIFLAPKKDERNESFRFREQRRLFIELDRFTVQLKSGNNDITRNSIESSVTIPHEMTYRDLDNNRPQPNTDAAEAFNICGCGWPQNMLIPKGKAEGLECQLFVMISNGADDQVQNSGGGGGQNTCDDASSYCGLRNSKYPDNRAMGFPFDRQPRDGVVTLQQFLTPNMFVQDVKIRFTDRVVPSAPRQNSQQNSQSNQSSGTGSGGKKPAQGSGTSNRWN